MIKPKMLMVYFLGATVVALLFYYLNYCKPLFCMACGHMGHSRSLKESVDRGTFVREYKGFKVLTDSLSQKVKLEETYFLERKFKYGLTNAGDTEIMPDSLGFVYQIGISRSDSINTSRMYTIYMPGDFYSIPDTIKCEIWPYKKDGEKRKKVGNAVIFK
jgi:hypothetical protein